ncbi:hypothetical protein Pla108_03840 [Botrimarina colliarenosi]|uniref:Uncharacterized protein n=1 Tax=Botrimarina colliarenosi TaxID=2528001 RepID=A0A5C6AJU9_9BACT|nr:hypothetical protein Pla108_03840 [Botrimarina colliarenosi]
MGWVEGSFGIAKSKAGEGMLRRPFNQLLPDYFHKPCRQPEQVILGACRPAIQLADVVALALLALWN